jgi:hypothetical protein
MLRDGREIPPSTAATLVIKIDGHEEEHQIVLYEGASKPLEPVGFF